MTALIDSGASRCILSHGTFEALPYAGYSLRQPQTIYGVGARVLDTLEDILMTGQIDDP